MHPAKLESGDIVHSVERPSEAATIQCGYDSCAVEFNSSTQLRGHLISIHHLPSVKTTLITTPDSNTGFHLGAGLSSGTGTSYPAFSSALGQSVSEKTKSRFSPYLTRSPSSTTLDNDSSTVASQSHASLPPSSAQSRASSPVESFLSSAGETSSTIGDFSSLGATLSSSIVPPSLSVTHAPLSDVENPSSSSLVLEMHDEEMQMAVPLLLDSEGSHDEHAMDLDLSGSEESQLMHHTWLYKLRLDINTVYKTLHCLDCCTALLPNGLKAHHKKHKIKLAKGDVETVKKICEEMGVITDYDNTPMPPIEGIPVEGLQIIPNGLKCKKCSRCVVEKSSFATHWTHCRSGSNESAEDASESTSLQSFFDGKYKKYFPVNSFLARHSKLDPFVVYLQTLVPDIDNNKVIVPVANVREVPPILQCTGWDEHLKLYTKTEAAVDCLLKLMTLPTGQETKKGIGRLGSVIVAFLKEVRTHANNTTLNIRSLLMTRQASTASRSYWQPHLSDETIDSYAALLHHFSIGVLRSHKGHQSGYKFPLTDADKQNANHLWSLLEHENDVKYPEAIDAFHNFFKPFLYPRNLQSGSKWEEVIECMLAVYCLEGKGIFKKASNITPIFAKLHYHIRGAIFYEGYKNRHNFESLYW